MRALAVPVAILRPCVLECLFFPRRLDGAFQPFSPLTDNGQLVPQPTAWERGCQEVAEDIGAYPWTHRASKIFERRSRTMPDACLVWNGDRGYRYHCCAAPFERVCNGLAEAEREPVGWAGCGARDRPPAEAAQLVIPAPASSAALATHAHPHHDVRAIGIGHHVNHTSHHLNNTNQSHPHASSGTRSILGRVGEWLW